ncbi:MAG: acetylesterase [Verrucomicrobiales bacterium VVV1]|nr:MAG: acetylesterase [Verrucomicrobiales bacterium VVV1]
MNIKSNLATIFSSLAIAAMLVQPAAAAGKPVKMTLPDFTKGEAIPEGANHDWNLGATGARGWMFCDKFVTTDARQISITKVDKGSPADGVLAVGDVILGAGGKPFSFDPRTEMGMALTLAESDAGGGKLALTRWRAGQTENVIVKLPVLGTYSPTAPYGCTKSKRILDQGIKALAQRMADPTYERKQNPITRSLNALALLANGDPAHLPLVKREAQWASGFSAESMATWYYGYVMILLSEYVTTTGDTSVMPGLKRLALEASKGQSGVGSWGHKFARPDGLLNGYGMMNAPGLPLTISLVMARDAGVKDPAVDKAIELSARLMRFYIGKGAIPYGDHEPWYQTHEDNGKCGMASVLFNVLGEAKGAEFFSRMSVASHGAERDCGHTGNFFNVFWSLPSVAQSGPQATGAWMKEFGAWYFDLARRPDGTFVHLGPPEPGNDSYANWDCTGAYLLAYALPLKKLVITGKKPAITPQLTAAQAQSLILDGRGWNNKDRKSFYQKLTEAELLTRLGSWSPIVRGRAAEELAARKEPPLNAIIVMLDSSKLDERVGACQALEMLKGAAAPAIPALRKTFNQPDLWLRIRSANALAAIGAPAMVALPEMLERLIKGATPEDPRGMEQRFLCSSVFAKMLNKSVDGVDKDLLRKAVARGLQNQDGRARGEIAGIYQRLSYEEIKPLLPAIHEAIAKPAPSGEMFADGIRLKGCELFAKNKIREGMELSLQLIEPDRWGSGKRAPQCFNIIGMYGAAAKPLVPKLQELEKTMMAQAKGKPDPSLDQLRTLIKSIESSTGTVELRSLN